MRITVIESCSVPNMCNKIFQSTIFLARNFTIFMLFCVSDVDPPYSPNNASVPEDDDTLVRNKDIVELVHISTTKLLNRCECHR